MQVITRRTAISREAGGAEAPRSTASLSAAEKALDPDALAEPAVLISFLVNALYLIGGQTLDPGAVDGAIPEALARLGHRTRARGRGGDAGLDRLFVPETFGRGQGHVEKLRELRKALRPGGLLAFHVIDRDRAWERTGTAASEGGRFRLEFDPADGRLIARDAGPAAPGRGPAVPGASIQTWNLGEAKSLVRAAGLVWERAYGDWEGGAPGSGRLIVVAGRPPSRPRKARARKRLRAAA